MAVVGPLAQSVVQLLGMENVPKGFDDALVGYGQIDLGLTLAITALLEAAAFVQDPSKEPGEFNDPPNPGDFHVEMRSKEFNNRRFAMFALSGSILARAYTARSALEQFGF